MLSNREEKLIRALRQKKTRQAENSFLIEGDKLLLEAIKSNFKILHVFTTPSWNLASKINIDSKVISERELKKVSNLKTPPGCLAILEMPNTMPIQLTDLTLVLDQLQDPGNLGTIIRSAAAFGVEQIICSTNTVDLYNPKVVQATMGALFHVRVYYKDLKEYLTNLSSKLLVYGAHLKGENIYQSELKTPALLLMGNESQGISPSLESFIHHKIKIPQSKKVESLNVSMATAVILSEFKRQTSWK